MARALRGGSAEAVLSDPRGVWRRSSIAIRGVRGSGVIEWSLTGKKSSSVCLPSLLNCRCFGRAGRGSGAWRHMPRPQNVCLGGGFQTGLWSDASIGPGS